MPHIFTNAEYSDMLYIYSFCDCSAMLLLKNTIDSFLRAEFQTVKCFPRHSIHCMNVIHFPVLVCHLNGYVNNMWRNMKTFLKCYSVALYLYLYLYFNSINPYWLPKPSDIGHVTYAHFSSKHRTSHLTTTFIKETIIIHN
jgi:hypothetical protein